MLSAASSSYAMDDQAAQQAAQNQAAQAQQALEFIRALAQLRAAQQQQAAQAAAAQPGAGLGAGGNMGEGLGRGIAMGFADPAVLQAIAANFRDGGQGGQAIQEIAGALFREGGRAMQEGLAQGADLDQGAEAGANFFGRNMGRFGQEIRANFAQGGEMRAGVDEIQQMAIHNSAQFADLFWHNSKKLALLSTAGYLAYFTYLYGGKVFWDYIDRKLKRPTLLIDSSKKGFFASLLSKPTEITKMVFSPAQEEQLGLITRATNNITTHIKEGKKNATYRNVLLYGPPGTGKTMFAQKLARESGMDFALITGASLSQFKDGTAITEIDKLFTWANKESSKGVVIFIDEVDSLLVKREDLKSDSEDYKIVNHILNKTGERSSKFMLIMTTNHKDNLDSAIYDRIDDYVEMALPDANMRKDVLALYISKIFLNQKDNGIAFVNHAKKVFTEQLINDLAQKTDGYSNRSLHGFVNMLFSNVLSTKDRIITQEIINKALSQMQQKMHLMAQSRKGKPDNGAQASSTKRTAAIA